MSIASTIRRQPTAQTSKPQPTLRFGERFGGCLVNGFAGTGATSYVYKARRVDSFEPVALKVLHPHLLEDEIKRTRFMREAQVMMRLNHPNIVRFHEIVEDEQGMAFIMEYIEGLTLDQWRARYEHELTEEVLASVFVDILRGLSHAHRHGIVHRDLKPGNILITFAQGRFVAKIIDFGVAKLVDEPMRAEECERIVGTAAYISPEEVIDPQTVCASSDLYSLGVMLYEAACGRRPFEGMALRELLSAHVNEAPVRPRDHNPGLSPSFESLILKTLVKSPDARFESAPEMIRAMELALQGAFSLSPEQWATMDDEVEVTTEWHRAIERASARRQRAIPAFLRRCFDVAFVLFTSTGTTGRMHDPHHFSRPQGANLPLM